MMWPGTFAFWITSSQTLMSICMNFYPPSHKIGSIIIPTHVPSSPSPSRNSPILFWLPVDRAPSTHPAEARPNATYHSVLLQRTRCRPALAMGSKSIIVHASICSAALVREDPSSISIADLQPTLYVRFFAAIDSRRARCFFLDQARSLFNILICSRLSSIGIRMVNSCLKCGWTARKSRAVTSRDWTRTRAASATAKTLTGRAAPCTRLPSTISVAYDDPSVIGAAPVLSWDTVF